MRRSCVCPRALQGLWLEGHSPVVRERGLVPMPGLEGPGLVKRGSGEAQRK